MTMPVVRQQTQVHDGFATIRSRGLYRSRSRAEDYDRYRTVSLKSDFSYKVNGQSNNDDIFSNAKSYSESIYSTPSPQYITFRPPLPNISHDYQNVQPNTRSSYESLKNGRNLRTPDSTLGESVSTFSNNESFPCGGSVRNSMSSSMHETYSSSLSTPYSTSPKFSIVQQDLAHNKQRRPPIRSATLSYRRAASCNDSPLSVYEPKNSLEFYNPTTNYYRPSEVTNRCSSAENLERAAPAWRNYRGPATPVVPSVSPVTTGERRYHTLGHTRGGGKDTKTTSYESLNPNPISIKSWESSNFNGADYADPLDWKIGCQTTLRSKPLVPWYELATMRGGNNRRSCPPFEAHVVAAFEQSLSNMTQRLQQLTATAERKDGELTEMRQTIELLRKQSIQAGLTTAHMQSMGVQTNSQTDAIIRQAEAQQKLQQNITVNGGVATGGGVASSNNASGIQRHHSSDSMCSLNSVSSGCSAQDKKKKKGWLRSSFTKAFSRNAKISKTNRHMSSTQSGLEQHHNHQHGQHNQHANVGSGQLPGGNVTSLPPPSPTKSPQKIVPIIENAKPIDAIDVQNNPIVEDLKKQLREKDLVLTDIRLEALSSASQLENLKDTVMKMRAEMITLKQNNERLQKLVTSRSLAGSEASLGNAVSPNGSIGECRRYSLADSGNRPPMELPKSLEEEVEEENIPPAPAPEPPPPPLSPTSHIDLTPPPPAIEVPSPTHLSNATAVEEVNDHTDGKKISIAVYLGQPESFPKYAEEILEADNYYCSSKHGRGDEGGPDGDYEDERDLKRFPDPSLNEFIVAYTYISGKTTWQNLDYIVRKTFKDYVSRVDPGTNLGLNTDSITSYHLGEAKRGPEMGFPELLPCGYIVGNVRTLYICLQGVGCLAFDSLIPRSIVHRYISLLTEHRRLILCGPSGTGKSYLARRLAEFLVARSGRGNLSEAIATFNVDHKSSKELRQYLGHIAEQASMSNGASELPSVIILDNLHHASSLGDVFSSLLSAGPAAKLPCIIGTMSQATCNTTNLQLHHNFRWVLTANHMEPVKGFLGRFLRRRLFTVELSSHTQQPELNSVLAWLPTVWQHINRFLENHSSSDVTIGPRLFLSCPLDLKESQVWFTDIWNYHLAPYLIEAVREGVQLYGRRGGAWNDPSTFIRDTYPWPYGPDSVPPLRQINAEDVGLEADAPGNSDTQDPLLNMLMRLQEAANYSGNQEQESDCASLDSNITPDSSAGAE